MQIPSIISSGVSLKNFNSFQIDESTRFFCKAENPEELNTALAFAEEQQLDLLVLGGGSNVLLTRYFPGLTIKIDNRGIEVLDKNDTTIRLKVAAGENWHEFVQTCLQNSWFGLENLSLIPGSVGAAPMQNIGAYGVEAGKWIRKVRYFHLERKVFEEISGEGCHFGYRESIFKTELKGKAIIWEVEFELSLLPEPSFAYGDIAGILKRDGIGHPAPADVSRAVIEIRQSKLPDPAVLGNAGSFFKNPVIQQADFERLKNTWPEIPSYPAGEGLVKVPAGWLIEKAGWKGYRDGAGAVHEKQALVLVNHGGAAGNDILNLAKRIISDIESKTGIRLQAEVNII